MIHFALISYSPNTAAMNRMRGYWDAFEEKGINVCVTILHQYNLNVKVQKDYKHIRFRYYSAWKGLKVFEIISFWVHLLRYSLSLRRGDVVYKYGIDKVTKFLSLCKGIKIVAEITEHPTIIDGGRITKISTNAKYKVAERVYRLVVISENLKQHFISAGIDAEKIEVINMIVDFKRFNGLVKHSNEIRYISYCGTASNNKDGVDELIKAFSLVVKQINGVKLRIIGNTPSASDISGNNQLIRTLDIEDKIEFTGQIPYDEVPQLLMDSDILALDRPDSIQSQCGFPTKLGEYLLTGHPVVVTNVGNISQFLIDGKSALLARERDAQDFANKLLWALNNPDIASKIGQQGRQVALNSFNSNIETLKLISLLKS